MMMPNRTYSAQSDYRYGFNGQERDDEMKGEGNSYYAEFWQYDSRLGRRWNVDQIVKDHESPYATFANNPILLNDPKGLDSDQPNDREPKKFHKPNFFTRVFRALNGDYFKTRADNYASKLEDSRNAKKIDRIDVDENTIVFVEQYVDTKFEDAADGNVITKVSISYRYSIFRKSGLKHNDDLGLTYNELLTTQIPSNKVLDASLIFPVGGATKGGLALLGKSGKALGIVAAEKVVDLLVDWKKAIKLGVPAFQDVITKGYHVHFKNIDGMEMGLRVTGEGIGLELVGQKTFSAAQVMQGVKVFQQAMTNNLFRQELLIKLKAAKDYLDTSLKGTRLAEAAAQRSAEIGEIIKRVHSW